MKKKYFNIFLFTSIFVLLDQFVKILVVSNYEINSYSIVVSNFFKIYYIRNYGAAFGFLNYSVWLLIGITVFMIYYIISEIKKNINSNLSVFSLVLILSGAFGNLMDRFFRGYVVDFLSFTLLNVNMPIFNIADIYITIGVFLYLYCILKEGK